MSTPPRQRRSLSQFAAAQANKAAAVPHSEEGSHLVENHIGCFRYNHTTAAQRRSTLRGARRRSISTASEGIDAVEAGGGADGGGGGGGGGGDSQTDEIVFATIADSTELLFAAQGKLLKRIDSPDNGHPEKWDVRWIEIRGPFVMQWRNEAASKHGDHSRQQHHVTMPDTVIDLRTVAEVGLHSRRILFLRFKDDLNNPEVLYRPADEKWVSEFHCWREAVTVTMAAYEEDPDCYSIVHEAGERIVDAANNPPPLPPPLLAPPSPPPLPGAAKADVAFDSLSSKMPTAHAVPSGAAAAGDEYDDYADAAPVSGCFACGLLISMPAYTPASERRSFFQSNMAEEPAVPIADEESDPQAWQLNKLHSNTVDIHVHSLVSTDPKFEQDRRFKVEVMLPSSGGGEDFFKCTNDTTFHDEFRFAHQSRVAWPTVARVIEVHFALLEIIPWFGIVCIARGQASFDTKLHAYMKPFTHNELISFYGVNDGRKLNITLRSEIKVHPTTPVSDMKVEVAPKIVAPPHSHRLHAAKDTSGAKTVAAAAKTVAAAAEVKSADAEMQVSPIASYHIAGAEDSDSEDSEYSYDTD